MKIVSRVALAALFAVASVGPAFAQATAPAVTAPAVRPAPRIIPLTPADPNAAKAAPAKQVAAKPATAKTERTALSQKCSADADAKGLHGKARAKFRNDCKKGKS